MTATSDESPRREHVKAHARAQFEKWALTYDHSLLNEIVFFPGMRAVLEEILRWKQRRSAAPYHALDVGCGTGSLLATLTRDPDAVRLVGLDYAAEMVRRTHDKLAALDTPERVAAVHGDAEHLPFPDGSFDVLTCCHSFHHYPHQAAVLAEFRRVLRPGGVLVLIDGFRDNVVGWVLFDVIVATVERHVHHASWSELRRMVADAGFGELRQRKLGVLAPLLVNVGAVPGTAEG